MTPCIDLGDEIVENQAKVGSDRTVTADPRALEADDRAILQVVKGLLSIAPVLFHPKKNRIPKKRFPFYQELN